MCGQQSNADLDAGVQHRKHAGVAFDLMPVRVAKTMPTGPSSSPMTTSGSVAVPGGPLTPRASHVRRMILSPVIPPVSLI